MGRSINSNSINICLRTIRCYGIEIQFYRMACDRFSEFDYSQKTPAVTVIGLYHNGSGTYETLNTDTGSVTTSKSTPMLLCDYASGIGVQPEDTCEIGGQQFRVLSITDVFNENKLVDISLEEIT